jgi:hypothetical protein
LWIGYYPDLDCRNFGKAGTPYDFAALDITGLKAKAAELEEAQKGMKKKINPKVINMIDRYAGVPFRSDKLMILVLNVAWRRKRLR